MLLVSSAAMCALALGAQAPTCLRPHPPQGAFAVQSLAAQVTLSDGYLSQGSLTMPVDPPPSCGWPLVVFVHPLGAWHGHDLAFQTWIASQGYAVWSYDVRGQGVALLANLAHPNRGTALWGPVELCDLAEQIQFAVGEPTWASAVDGSAIAVIGSSQGGAHAWQAAAWSEALLEVPSRPPVAMPRIRCAAAFDLAPNPVDGWLHGGGLFNSWFLEAISGSYQGTPFDEQFLQTCRDAFLAQDPGALRQAFLAEGRDITGLLAGSTVPVLYGHAYFDNVGNPLAGVVALEGRAVPGRAVLSTIGHAVPGNIAERAFRQHLTILWLHRFLWCEANEVDLDVPHVLAELPLAAAQRDDPSHLWSRANVADLRPPIAATRLHLHPDLLLRTAPPDVATIGPALEQTIDPNAVDFTPAGYLDQPVVRELASVLAACPLVEQVHTFVLTEDSQLRHSASLRVVVVPDHPAWMLAAALTVQPDAPLAEEVLLAGGAMASRDSVPGIAEVHEMRLPPIAARLPAGATLRLRLRNLWLQEPPMITGLHAVPILSDYRIAVGHGPEPDGSWLDLPIEPVAPRLVVDTGVLDLAAPTPIEVSLRGGLGRAGDPYFAAVGLSGQWPPTPFLNALLPIDGDWLVVASAGSTQSPHFHGFLGFLDPGGEAVCRLDFSPLGPLPSFLNGLRLTLVAFVWDGPWAPAGMASNPADVLLR